MIKDKPKIIKIIKKRTVIIECVVVSKFEPKCMWFKETTEVRESERHKVDIQQVKDGEFAVKLEISQIADIDKGSYKLVARNEKGEATSQIVELVDIPEEERKAIKPQIVKQLRNATLVEGKGLELVAAIKEADKKAKVLWYKNSTVVTEHTGREYQTSFDGTTARLTILHTTTEHTATYRIVFSNEVGGDESTSKVEVKKDEKKKEEEEEVSSVEYILDQGGWVKKNVSNLLIDNYDEISHLSCVISSIILCLSSIRFLFSTSVS